MSHHVPAAGWRAVVVFESAPTATAMIARSVAAGLASGGCTVTVHDTTAAWTRGLPACDLLVVGCPTHAFCLDRSSRPPRSRLRSVKAETTAVGLPQLLSRLRRRETTGGGLFATFDTRVSRIRDGRTAAASRAAHALARQGLHPVTYPTAFLVDDQDGPVAQGETDRARAWGAMVARSVAELRHDASAVGAGDLLAPRSDGPGISGGGGRPSLAVAWR